LGRHVIAEDPTDIPGHVGTDRVHLLVDSEDISRRVAVVREVGICDEFDGRTDSVGCDASLNCSKRDGAVRPGHTWGGRRTAKCPPLCPLVNQSGTGWALDYSVVKDPDRSRLEGAADRSFTLAAERVILGRPAGGLGACGLPRMLRSRRLRLGELPGRASRHPRSLLAGGQTRLW